MKKIYSLLFSSIAMLTSLSAQNWGFGQQGYYTNDVAVGADGNIWVCAYSGNDPLGADINANYVLKLNSDGEKQWGVAPFPGGVFGFGGTAYNVMPQADGGVIVYYTNLSGLPSVYKLDADGNLLWDSSDDWSGDYYFYGGTAVQLTDGRIVIGGLGDFEHHFYVTDDSGNLISTFDVAPDTTGGWAMGYFDFKETGMVATADGGFAYATGNDFYKILYKYNSELNLEWSAYYDWMTDWEYGLQNSLKTTADGGFLLAGSSLTFGGNYNGTLRKIDAAGNLEWGHLYNHGYAYEEGAWAVELGDGYIIWTQDGGDNSSAGWVLDADGVETGSIEIPIVNCNWGVSEFGMEVWDVEEASDGGYIIAGRQYVEDCTSRTTVIKSNPDGTFDPCLFNCVWPGDANNDGLADMSDLFEIGINYGASGFSREDMGIDWSGKLSRAWMEEDSVYWYIINDLKWTDCNGDGTINDGDTTAVSLNFGLDHPLNNLKTSSGDVPLNFAPVDPMLHIGLNEIPIVLGDDATPVDEIYGLSFTIEISGTENIDANSLKVTFNDSWLSTADTRLSISKTNGDEYLVFAGLVRKDRANVGGSGEIGTLSIVVIDNITGKMESEEATAAFIEAKAIKLNREEIALETGSVTFPVEESESVSTQNIADIRIYPNPASEILSFENLSGKIIDEIIITDITGKILMSETELSTQVIDITNLEAGNYFIKFKCADEIIVQKFAVQ